MPLVCTSAFYFIFEIAHTCTMCSRNKITCICSCFVGADCELVKADYAGPVCKDEEPMPRCTNEHCAITCVF